MARTLGAQRSTISRELAATRVLDRALCVAPAQVAQHEPARGCAPCRPSSHPQASSWRVVLTLLDWKWSPQQIAGTLKRVFPNEPERTRLARDHLHGHLRPAAR